MGYQTFWRSGVALMTVAAIVGTSTSALAEETNNNNNAVNGEQLLSQQAAPERGNLPDAIKAKIESDSSQANAAAPAAQASTAEIKKGSWFTDNFGMNYNSFFAGPALTNAKEALPPSYFGGPDDTGMYFWNLISVKKKKFIGDLALDVQFRGQIVVNNQTEGESALQYRHQGQRVGLSGKLLKGKDWALSGAVNTDLPIRAITGQINSERTLLMNPGMFATFSWDPAGSKWGLFALLTPRVFFYSDRGAKSAQDKKWEDSTGGNSLAVRKPELILIAAPSVSYTFNEKAQARLGVQLDYEKMVAGSGFQRLPMGVELGFGYDVASWLNVYTYLQTSTPLDDTIRANAGSSSKWYETASLNVWFSGNVF